MLRIIMLDVIQDKVIIKYIKNLLRNVFVSEYLWWSNFIK